jgi:hypothetical protein
MRRRSSPAAWPEPASRRPVLSMATGAWPGAPLSAKEARAVAWLGSGSALASARRFAAGHYPACVHCYLAVLAVELVLRGGLVRLVERSLVALNLACWVLAPWLPLRNTTLGKHQVAIAHHPGLPIARWLGLKWFTTGRQRLRARARVAAEIIGSDAWEIEAVARLLDGVSCRRRCTPRILAKLVARRYNPYHPEYEALILRALESALETFADGSYAIQCVPGGGFARLESHHAGHVPTLIRIPKIGLIAEIEAKDLSHERELAPPDHPYCVAWYTFTARPGSPGSSLLAAQRRWWGIGPAAFCRLEEVGVGDLIVLQTGHGPDLRYRVCSEDIYSGSNFPVSEMLEAGADESLTLVSIADSSDPTSPRSGTWLVLRAERG